MPGQNYSPVTCSLSRPPTAVSHESLNKRHASLRSLRCPDVSEQEGNEEETIPPQSLTKSDDPKSTCKLTVCGLPPSQYDVGRRFAGPAAAHLLRLLMSLTSPPSSVP